MTEQKVLKTGTTTLGMVCTDGLVIAADKRSTAGGLIFERDADKIQSVVDDIIVTTAGSVSETQRLIKLIRAELKLIEVRTSRPVTVKETANLLTQMIYYNVRSMPFGGAHFLVAGKDIQGFELYEAGWDGVIKKEDKYIATGSGLLFALPILEANWKPGMSLQEGIKLAADAINAAQLRDTASGSGFDIYTITKDGVTKVVTKSLTVKAEV